MRAADDSIASQVRAYSSSIRYRMVEEKRAVYEGQRSGELSEGEALAYRHVQSFVTHPVGGAVSAGLDRLVDTLEHPASTLMQGATDPSEVKCM